MSDLFAVIVKYYEELFAKVSGFQEYVFTPSLTQKKMINNFIQLLGKEVGLESVDVEYLFNFITYQFYLKKDQKTRFGKGMVMLNHVIGKTAFSRWVRKSDNWYYWTGKFIDDYGIKRPERVEVVFNSAELNVGEENFKKLKTGLAGCTDMTSLYNPSSTFCEQCGDKKDCMIILRELYPNIYKKRVKGESL